MSFFSASEESKEENGAEQSVSIPLPDDASFEKKNFSSWTVRLQHQTSKEGFSPTARAERRQASCGETIFFLPPQDKEAGYRTSCHKQNKNARSSSQSHVITQLSRTVYPEVKFMSV